MKFIYILLYNMGNVQFKVPKIKDIIEEENFEKTITNFVKLPDGQYKAIEKVIDQVNDKMESATLKDLTKKSKHYNSFTMEVSNEGDMIVSKLDLDFGFKTTMTLEKISDVKGVVYDAKSIETIPINNTFNLSMYCFVKLNETQYIMFYRGTSVLQKHIDETNKRDQIRNYIIIEKQADEGNIIIEKQPDEGNIILYIAIASFVVLILILLFMLR
mgnify:CR=1 FL=1